MDLLVFGQITLISAYLMHEMAFTLRKGTDCELAWELLDAAGCQLLYSSEEIGSLAVIFGRLPSEKTIEDVLGQCPFLIQISEASFDNINWEAQWSLHCKNYKDGFLNVPITGTSPTALNTTLRLKPGPGFGDLSHPTTRLVLSLMPKYVKGLTIVDIGCGSGILSLAAIAMGAKKAIGIDIDNQALVHARENAELNEMENQLRFCFPEECCLDLQDQKAVALMNMIQSEQMQAWTTLNDLHSQIDQLLTSGILKEGRKAYLKQAKTFGWQLISEVEEEGWLGFYFCK